MSKKELFVLKDLLATNNQVAAGIRRSLRERGVLAVNLLSSPGSGKTTLLERLVDILKNDQRLAVIEGDVETERDAERIRAHGVPARQITTGGACHLDARMVGKALADVPADIDILFIENVGNLVCPASFDLGETLRCVLLSAPEGDDKPKKYPKAFLTAHCLILTKMDLAGPLEFDADRAVEEALSINPGLKVFRTSAKTGEGVAGLAAYFVESLGKTRPAGA